MNKLNASLYAEILKILRSKMLIGTIMALSLAPIFGALFVIVMRNPSLIGSNRIILLKASLIGFSADWHSFFNLLSQAIGIGGMVVFGFVASWVFGREYSDHTAKDLLVLPISRFLIVVSKIIVIVLWCLFLTIIVFLLGLFTGLILQLPGWSFQIFSQAIISIFITSLLAISLCFPVTFITSIGKGYIVPLSFVVLSIIVAQILGALGFGAYFPWAIPAIYSKVIGTQTILNFQSYLVLILTSFLGMVGTIYWWKYADQTM